MASKIKTLLHLKQHGSIKPIKLAINRLKLIILVIFKWSYGKNQFIKIYYYSFEIKGLPNPNNA